MGNSFLSIWMNLGSLFLVASRFPLVVPCVYPFHHGVVSLIIISVPHCSESPPHEVHQVLAGVGIIIISFPHCSESPHHEVHQVLAGVGIIIPCSESPHHEAHQALAGVGIIIPCSESPHHELHP